MASLRIGQIIDKNNTLLAKWLWRFPFIEGGVVAFGFGCALLDLGRSEQKSISGDGTDRFEII